MEANVYLDNESVGFSEEGDIDISIEEIRDSDRIRLEGSENNISFAKSYSTSEINLSLEKPLLEASGEDIGYHLARFYVHSSGEPLNGEVFQRSEKLGETTNGSIYISPERLETEEIFLNGTYNGSDFSFIFDYTEDMRDSKELEFYVKKDVLNSEIFDARDLETSEIEEEVLQYVNDVRNQKDVPPPSSGSEGDLTVPEITELPEVEPVRESENSFTKFSMPNYLEMNDDLRYDARLKSREMIEESYFSHESPSGDSVTSRLNDKEIFFIMAGENLAKTRQIPYYWDETDVAREIVRSWEDSPAHRSLMVDRDRLYTDAGIGVECTENSCYATLVVSKRLQVRNNFLEDEYCSYTQIHDSGWGISPAEEAEIKVRVDGSVDAYIVDNREKAFDDCIDRDRIDAFEEFERTEGFEYSYSDVGTEDAVVMASNSDSNISIQIDYLSGTK